MPSDQQWKRDDGKPRVDLLPVRSLIAASRVLGHGASKYEANSWRSVPDPAWRYYASALRHMFAWAFGEDLDKESGLSHLSHALTNLMFLVELEEEKNNATETDEQS